MKSKFYILLGAFGIIALVFATILVSRNSISNVGTTSSAASQVKTITASGEGVIEAVPNVAYVNLGVVTEGKELAQVQKGNSDKMAKVIASLTKLGIRKEDIKTTNYNVNPKYDYNQNTGVSTIIGYTVSNTLEVTINDITKTGNLLDEVVASGSNSVNSVIFGLKDKTVLYNQALELAVKDAKAKATAMGKGSGISSIQVSKVTEVSNINTPVYFERSAAAMDVAKQATPISEGELKVTANVTVEFSFK
jgi:uncharacterized protein